MNAVDTNVWIYTHDTRHPRKQQLAIDAIATARPMVLPWQVGCEFVAAARKLIPSGFTEQEIWRGLEYMRSLAEEVALPDVEDWDSARLLQSQEVLSFWDALLVATCLRHGVTTLYTEDFGSPRTIRTLNVINPFTSPIP